MGARLLLTALAVALAGLLGTPAAPGLGATDPAQTALRARDAYVSPRALGAAAPAAEARLAEAAAQLGRGGRPVKLAVVAGPAGAPSMRAYAAGLRRVLGADETVVVTAPSRPVVAVGPRSPAEVTGRLRAAGAGRVADPVDRVIAAARAAAPPPPASGANVREIGALLGVAVLGGLWAVAIGLRRERRRAGARAVERRAALHVYLDALGAQATALEDEGALTTSATKALTEARAAHAGAAAALLSAREPRSLAAAEATLREGLAALDRARERAGAGPLADPFAGLCATDPAHGRAVATLDADGAPTPVCAACRDAGGDGRLPPPRLVPVDGAPVAYARAALTRG